MEQIALAERRDHGNQAHYLVTQTQYQTLGPGYSNKIKTARQLVEVSVFRFLDPAMRAEGMCLLSTYRNGFNATVELHAAEARLIAQALLMAADDADKALEAAQDEVAA